MALIGDLLRKIRSAFKKAGIAQEEAEYLLAHILGISRAEVHLKAREHLPAELLPTLEMALKRRLSREPLAYIFGEVEFYGRPFRVGPGVLIPRPETELLVETVIGLCPGKEPFLLDLGTGSGVIGITLALERQALVVAIDKSLVALSYAQDNLLRYRLKNRVFLVASDWCQALRPQRVFQVVVSNPPYVGPEEWPHLAPEIKDFEPQEALVAREGGLSAIKKVIACAWKHLAPGGFLVCEIGARQADKVLALAQQAGLLEGRIIPDLAGNPRILVARQRREDSH